MNASQDSCIFQFLGGNNVSRCFAFAEARSGLRAFIVIDDVTLGPAVGGIRIRQYSTVDEALQEVRHLARAMTLKCSIAGLAAGGAKAVILDGPDLRRRLAFEQMGRFIEELGGMFRTAGDMGTTSDDLDGVALHTSYVDRREQPLFSAAAQGLIKCMQACVAIKGGCSLDGLRVAIQGCGAIGTCLARALKRCNVTLLLADTITERAEELAREVGASTIAAGQVLTADVDIVSPCAFSSVITKDIAARIRAWAICGGANNQLADCEAGRILSRRNVLFVPDIIASAGAVIEGIGFSLMHLPDRSELIDRLGVTAKLVIEESLSTGESSAAVAERHALGRIARMSARTA